MAKTAKKIEENFFTSSVFTFDSYSCDGELTSVFTNLSSVAVPAIKFSPRRDMSIHFAFGSKVGLVRLNDDGSIAESNILGKLVAIDRDDPTAYIKFFQTNGFLLPLALDKSETIGIMELQCLVDRLQATLELMSTITDMSRTSYEKIVRLLFYHLFAPVVSIEVMDGRYKYNSDRHQYSAFLDSNKDAKRDERLNDLFNNATFSFSDTVTKFELDADFVDSVLNGNPAEEKYASPLFQQVFTAYCMPRETAPKRMAYINDFMFHYLYEVGIVEHVDLDNTYYVNGEVNKAGFSKNLKQKAVEISKFVIKEEIETNLRRVRPTYNISTLEPAWKIDSLLSALYFGLFYMRPTMETYRRCANPKCGEFFLVPVSSRKKKYCCRACMNRNMAARKRARDKVLASAEQ